MDRAGSSETACGELRILLEISGRDQISTAAGIVLAAMERAVRIWIRMEIFQA